MEPVLTMGISKLVRKDIGEFISSKSQYILSDKGGIFNELIH